MFTLAIIGRPNVGKSTLFNKLVGRSFAIVDDTPGVTRDRKDAFGQLGPMEFRVIDTAGLEQDLTDKQLETRMVAQTQAATLDADLCLFVVDGKVGVTEADIYFTNWIRKSGKKSVLIVNKCDGKTGEIFDKQYYKLGFGQAVAISAEHKDGFNFLYDLIEPAYEEYQKNFGAYEAEVKNNEDTDKLQIAVVGKPNAGKSTFLNKLLGKERLITGPEAGITRDAIAIDWEFEGKTIRLIDTAGIRRKSNITKKLEELSLLDSFRAIRYAQVAIILIDAQLGIDHQDLAIASMVVKEGRGVVIAINKFDLIEDGQKFIKEIRLELEKSLPEIAGSPIVPVSSLSGYNVEKTLSWALQVYEEWQKYIPTSKLNEWLKLALERHPPILVKGKPTKIKYITQAKKRPPTFAVFTNYPDAIKGSYERYLMNSLREYFGLTLTLVRLILKKSENPFKDVKYKKFSKKTKDEKTPRIKYGRFKK